MTPIKLNPDCVACLIKKYSKDYPAGADENLCRAFTGRVLEIINTAPKTIGAPEIVEKIDKVRLELFGEKKDFTDIKRHFNNLIMGMEYTIWNNINNSDSPLKSAVQYAMMGNYIDFGAMAKVDEDKLLELIGTAHSIDIATEEFENFKREIQSAKSLVYLTDNCGEVVFDKLMIKTIKKLYPDLEINVIVRGENVLNDATMDDAVQIGLTDIVNVTGNGSGIAGTSLESVNAQTRAKIDNADIIIAKGQGNFETLRYCGKNIYYIFMCKCEMFASRFNVPRFSGMFINDLRMD